MLKLLSSLKSEQNQNIKYQNQFQNRSPKIKTKNIKNYSSILAIVNHRNWLDDSPPLIES